MARLKLLLLAAVVAALGAYDLAHLAQSADSRIHQSAEERLVSAVAAVSTSLQQESQNTLTLAKAIAQNAAVARAMDDEGKPTAEALETARGTYEKAQYAESERPLLVVIAAQGVVGRYRVNQGNRFDKDLNAFPVLAEKEPLPRAGLATLDGDTCRFALAQFDDSKVPDAKGIVAVGFPLDDQLAGKLAHAGGVEVTLVQQGKVLGSSLPTGERATMGGTADGARAGADFGALSGERFVITDLVPPLTPLLKLPLFVEGHRFHAVLVPPLPGMPADLRVMLATRTSSGYAALADDQRFVLFGCAILILLCLLLAAFTRDRARGLSRVVSIAERIVQGDYQARAPIDEMTPLVRRAAVAINTLATHAEAGAKPVTPSFAEQLGIKPSRPSATLAANPAADIDNGPLATFGNQPAPAEGGSRTEPSLGDVDSFLAGIRSQPPAGALAGLTALGSPSSPPAPMPPPEPPGGPPSFAAGTPQGEPVLFQPRPPTAPSPVTAAQPSRILPPQPYQVSSVPQPYQAPSADEFTHDTTVVAQTPEALIRATQRSPSFAGAPPPSSFASPASPYTPPAPVTGPVPLPPPSGIQLSSDDAHFQQVYREFVSTREKCGEAADGLTYEKFAAKLRKNQEQLVAKYACRTVRFQVYVKEGKAALKATPVR